MQFEKLIKIVKKQFLSPKTAFLFYANMVELFMNKEGRSIACFLLFKIKDYEKESYCYRTWSGKHGNNSCQYYGA